MGDFLTNFTEGSVFLYWFGAASVAYIVVITIRWLYQFYHIHFTEAAVKYGDFGKWALVTGSTDGIGKGIALELAERGLNIVLVSRNSDKLKRVANEIEEQFNVETRCVAFDFTKAGEDADGKPVYDIISDAIADLEIGILVNNVGMNSKALAYYHESYGPDFEDSSDLINCNVTSMFEVSKIVLPQMVKRRKGLVVNISSLIADLASPKVTLYAGSKKCADTYSRALSYEYEKHGIVVQSIKPGFVYTNLTTGRRKLTIGTFSPHYLTYSRHLMKTVGKVRSTTGYWFHHLFAAFLTCLPEKLIVMPYK